MSYAPWYYFLSIEKDFIKTIDYVELHSDNKNAFSNEYAKLLLLIGSEVDVVAKMLCHEVTPAANAKNIEDYRETLTADFNGIHTVEIEISRYALKCQPWINWDQATSKSPSWWKSYNNLKHERNNNFAEANQTNTLNALCGLLVLLLYLYRNDAHLQPYPELLNYGFPSYLVTEGGKHLPGT